MLGSPLSGLWPFYIGDFISPSGNTLYAFLDDNQRLVIVVTLGYQALFVEVSRRRLELGVGDARPSHYGQREHGYAGGGATNGFMCLPLCVPLHRSILCAVRSVYEDPYRHGDHKQSEAAPEEHLRDAIPEADTQPSPEHRTQDQGRETPQLD